MDRVDSEVSEIITIQSIKDVDTKLRGFTSRVAGFTAIVECEFPIFLADFMKDTVLVSDMVKLRFDCKDVECDIYHSNAGIKIYIATRQMRKFSLRKFKDFIEFLNDTINSKCADKKAVSCTLEVFIKGE